MAKQSTGTWFVYILRCVDGTLYTGITKDVDRRTRQHNAGTASRCTRSRRPVKLVYQEPQRSQSLSLRREAEIKKLARRQKLAFIGVSGVECWVAANGDDGPLPPTAV
jgi:predicted GIY-YIG superfamily endonuclease